MDDLKPCPFCGGQVEVWNRYGDDQIKEAYDISCATTGCYLQCGAEWFLSKEELLLKWNSRV